MGGAGPDASKIVQLVINRLGDTIIFMMPAMAIAKLNGIAIEASMVG